MKKYFFYICLALLYGNVQAQRGYVKVRGSITILGTRGIVKGMEDAGYGPKGVGSWLGGTIDYPVKHIVPSLDIEGGFYIAERKSLSVLVGVENSGYIDGHSSFNGTDVKLKHKGHIISPKLNFHGHSTLLGLGPTFMVFQYKNYVNYSETSKNKKLYSGISATAETFFGSERRFRVGLFSTLNLYKGSNMQIIDPSTSTGAGYSSKFSPTNIQAGLVLCYGNK